MKPAWSQTGPSVKPRSPATRVSFALRSNNFQNFGDSAVSLKVLSGTTARTEMSGSPAHKTTTTARAVAVLIPRLWNQPLTNDRIFTMVLFIPSLRLPFLAVCCLCQEYSLAQCSLNSSPDRPVPDG